MHDVIKREHAHTATHRKRSFPSGRHIVFVAANDDGADARKFALLAERENVRRALSIAEYNDRTAIVEGVLYFGTDPERVGRDRNAALRGDCHEREDPFRVVAHEVRDTLTRGKGQLGGKVTARPDPKREKKEGKKRSEEDNSTKATTKEQFMRRQTNPRATKEQRN